ncbi:MAG: metallophosphoesterase, partial [Deltaproteobacteria bacterium]|nr:metallophosphoesterase [Deltaproteobacteria bacterium]
GIERRWEKMTYFIFFFFLIYGSMHYYFFYKLNAALHLPLPAVACLVLFLILMIIAPLLVNVIERQGSHMFARASALVCYSWMGVLFCFFSLSLLVDFYRLLHYLAGYLTSGDLQRFLPAPKPTLFITLFIALAIFVYGFFEAREVRIEKVVVKSAKISPSMGRIRIAQISDLHIGMVMQGERLKKIVAQLKACDPDILVSTGDLVDGQSDSLFNAYPFFKDLSPRLGKFAVTGNHELYAGLARSLDFTRRAGFSVLRGEGRTVGGLINIAGFDDVVVRGGNPVAGEDFATVLNLLPPGKFTLLLYHRPVVAKDSLGAFDLQLSGHTHKGQIFPFSLVTGLFFPMQAGYYNLPNHSALYVSRGTGTWGPPIRFLAPPEITIFDLVPENSKI